MMVYYSHSLLLHDITFGRQSARSFALLVGLLFLGALGILRVLNPHGLLRLGALHLLLLYSFAII
jgi:hypothetical protein